MDRKFSPGTKPEHRTDEPPARTSPNPALPAGLDADQLDRWADLIADGRGEFPPGLAPHQRDYLLVAVRRQHRDRLVRHIARAVATRLRREAGPGMESDPYA